MKKVLISLLLGGLVFTTNVSAQKDVKAFEHLSVGIEAGTTGFGINVATPLSKNFALRGGFVMLPFSYKTSFSLNFDPATLTDITNVLRDYPHIKTELEQKGLPSSASDISTDLNTTAKLGLVNGKVLVDYYPWSSYSFHLTGGVYFGSDHLIKIEANLPDETSRVIKTLDSHLAETGVNFGNKQLIDNYSIAPNDLYGVDATISTNSVKPYFGIGFGRAVPKSRVGVQFDLGTMYHGKPALTSQNPEVQRLMNNELDGDIIDIMEKISMYPVMTLKVVFRIF